jgi:hypothetical protein
MAKPGPSSFTPSNEQNAKETAPFSEEHCGEARTFLWLNCGGKQGLAIFGSTKKWAPVAPIF